MTTSQDRPWIPVTLALPPLRTMVEMTAMPVATPSPFNRGAPRWLHEDGYWYKNDYDGPARRTTFTPTHWRWLDHLDPLCLGPTTARYTRAGEVHRP